MTKLPTSYTTHGHTDTDTDTHTHIYIYIYITVILLINMPMALMQVYVTLLFSPPSLNLALREHVTPKRDLVERTKARRKPA